MEDSEGIRMSKFITTWIHNKLFSAIMCHVLSVGPRLQTQHTEVAQGPIILRHVLFYVM